jgi:hypothetical protein
VHKAIGKENLGDRERERRKREKELRENPFL